MKDLQAAAGTVLMDTGLTNMMLAVPDGPGKGDVPDGTLVTVELLGGKAQYSFKVGDATEVELPVAQFERGRAEVSRQTVVDASGECRSLDVCVHLRRPGVRR